MADESESLHCKNAPRKCGCTGIRSCLLCQNDPKINSKATTLSPDPESYLFCHKCGETVPASLDHVCEVPLSGLAHNQSGAPAPILRGVTVIEDFVTEDEEKFIVNEIDKTEWKISQSGRLKQDYGPQVNFKRKKVKTTHFDGLPYFSKFLVERMNSCVDILADFVPVELCNLDYTPERGSAIDPHFDDFWLWGEKLVTINLLSSTKLTMSKDNLNAEVFIVMPQRSLIIVGGPARYEWKHAIKRQHILSRRIAITLRELSQEFCKGGTNEETGSQIINTALSFKGKSVQANIESLGPLEVT